MTASGSYRVQESHRDAESEIQRLAAQARLGWEKEARTLSWFGLRDGMSLLEPGSGPGFITESLLSLLPNSSITCLEIDPTMIIKAAQTLQHRAKDRLQFVEGSVMDIRLPADSFDFVYARALFQHLPDPIGAAKEIRRVLKPGGKLVIYDIDDKMYGLIHPPIPGFEDVLQRFAQAQAARGGDRHIGWRLWRILQAAGLRNLDLEVIAFHSDYIGLEPFLPQIDPDRLLPLVRSGLLAEEELEKTRLSHAQFLASPEPFILLLIFMVCGQKL